MEGLEAAIKTMVEGGSVVAIHPVAAQQLAINLMMRGITVNQVTRTVRDQNGNVQTFWGFFGA